MWDAKKYATCNEQKRECFVRKSKKSSPNLDKYTSLQPKKCEKFASTFYKWNEKWNWAEK